MNLQKTFKKALTFGSLLILIIFLDLPLTNLISAQETSSVSKTVTTNISNKGAGSLEKENKNYGYTISETRINELPSKNILQEAQKNNLKVVNEIISQRTPNSRTYQTNKEAIKITEIISGVPQYYKDDQDSWYQVEHPYAGNKKAASKEQGSLFLSLKHVFLNDVFAATTTSTFFSDPNPETSTVDGYVRHRTGSAGTGISWSNIRGGAGTEAGDSNTEDGYVLVEADTTTGNWRIIDRVIRLFDTSSIPDSDIIFSATYSESTQVKNTDNFNCEINVYGSNPASNTSLVAGDFDSLGGDETSGEPFSTAKTMASMSATEGAYSDWAFNSSGLNYINKTGITKLGLRESKYDGANIEPTWASANFCQFIFNNSEETGTSKDPKLVVVHGDGFTIDLGNRKSADESLANSSALQDDDELFLKLPANTTYAIDGAIFVSSTSVIPDIKIAFTFPNDSIMDVGFMAADSGSFSSAQLLETSGASSNAIALTANTPQVIHIKGTIKMGSSSGNINFQWAQNTSNANATVVKEGSYLKAGEI